MESYKILESFYNRDRILLIYASVPIEWFRNDYYPKCCIQCIRRREACSLENVRIQLPMPEFKKRWRQQAEGWRPNFFIFRPGLKEHGTDRENLVWNRDELSFFHIFPLHFFVLRSFISTQCKVFTPRVGGCCCSDSKQDASSSVKFLHRAIIHVRVLFPIMIYRAPYPFSLDTGARRKENRNVRATREFFEGNVFRI